MNPPDRSITWIVGRMFKSLSQRILCLGLCACVAACAGPGPFTKPLQGRYVKPVPVEAAPETAPATETGTTGQPPLDTVLQGSGEFLARDAGAQQKAVATPGSVELNFVDADVREVLRVLLGELLSLNYVVDPAIEGRITLQSSQPVAQEDVYPLLSQALELNGLTITQAGGVYTVVKAENAQRQLRALRSPLSGEGAPQGYGIWAVPLKFVSAVEMQKILEPFAPQGNIVRVDSARNLLLIAGTQREVATLLDTIAVFDTDWMKGMSFGLFELTHVDSETVAEEMKEIFNVPGSPVQDLVRIIPLPRLNAVLVMSPRQEYLAQVQDWIRRLDRGREKVSRRIYVYYVQNGKADDLVTSLGGILGSDGDRDSIQSDRSEPTDAGPDRENSEAVGSGGNGSTSVLGSSKSQRISRSSTGPLSGGSAGFDTSSEAAVESKRAREGAAFENNGMRFYADNKNNAILIYGTAGEYDLVLGALRQLDAAPLQVLIEATIIEVGLTNELNFGVEWFFKEGKNRIDLSATGIPTQVFPGFSYLYGGTNLRAVVNTLSSLTDVHVISSPQLLVVNNETARLQVGDEVPVPTQSAVSITEPDAPIVNSIEYKDSGVILVVTPRINNNGSVYMEITQEVSDVVANVTSGIDAPTFQQRKINSTVVIEDNETIALGGLIRDNRTKTKSGVPFLKDIPLLGLPFRNTDNTRRRTELLIFITPHVIRNGKDARALTDYLRLRLDEEHRKGPLGIRWPRKEGANELKPFVIPGAGDVPSDGGAAPSQGVKPAAGR